MWTLVMTFLLFQDLTSAEYLCDQVPTEYCEKDYISFEIPHDVNDLDSLCSAYVKYVECLQFYETMCPDEYIIVFFTAGDSAMTYKLIKEVCRNNSRLLTEFREHASCIDNTVASQLDDCTSISESKSENYFTFLREEIKNGGLDVETVLNDYFVLPPCLWHTYTIACAINRIEDTCGTSASAVATEIIERSSFLLQSCCTEDFPKLQTGFLGFVNHTNDSELLSKIINSAEFLDVITQLEVW